MISSFSKNVKSRKRKRFARASYLRFEKLTDRDLLAFDIDLSPMPGVGEFRSADGPNGEDVLYLDGGEIVQMNVLVSADPASNAVGWQLQFNGSAPELQSSMFVYNPVWIALGFLDTAGGQTLISGANFSGVDFSSVPQSIGQFVVRTPTDHGDYLLSVLPNATTAMADETGFTGLLEDLLVGDYGDVLFRVGVDPPVNFPPVPGDDTATTDSGVSVDIPILNNDTDPEGDTISLQSFGPASGGDLSVNPDASLTYTPRGDFSGLDTFQYIVNDGNGNTAAGTVRVTVNRIEHAPVAMDDTGFGVPDQPVTIDVLANDTDLNDDALTVTEVTMPISGTTAIENNSVVYTPNAGFEGDDVFRYTITDGHGGSDTATVAVTIERTATPPVATDDTATTDQFIDVDIPVLTNDSDLENDPLTITATTPAANGTVTIDGMVINYAPTDAFFGTDQFSYTISDGTGRTDTAQVLVTVNRTVFPPNALADNATTVSDTQVTIDALANDTEPSGEALSLTEVTQPANGEAVIENNMLLYTPGAAFTGIDTFTYTVSDGTGETDTALVTVTVNRQEHIPVANDDAVNTAFETAVVVSVLDNDTDENSDPLTITQVGDASNGTAELVNDTIEYTPNAGFSGNDTFTYTITDGTGRTDTATVTVTVFGLIPPPVASDDTADATVDTAVTIDVLANDSQANGNPLTLISTTQPANGNVTIENNMVLYTPSAGFLGVDTFSYTISDASTGGTDNADVTVTVSRVEHTPVANDDDVSTLLNESVNIMPLANDTDMNSSDVLTVLSITQPTNGTATLDGNDVTYEPTANFTGDDSFTYQISDGTGRVDTGTISITVTNPNLNPTAANDTATTSDQPVNIDVLANDSDPDGDALTVIQAGPSPNGTVTAGSPVVYEPNAGFEGTDTFSYTVSDGNGGIANAFVTVVVTGTVVPDAVDDNPTTRSNVPVQIFVLDNDTDPGGQPLTLVSVSIPVNGTAVANQDNTVTYTPNVNFVGTDSFTYTVTNGGGSSTATVTVEILPGNGPPTANDDTFTTDEGVVATIDALANDTDGEGDSLVILSVTTDGTATVSTDGQVITYEPADDFIGMETLTYTISDNNGLTDSATVSVVVNEVPNRPPVAVDDTSLALIGRTTNIDVLANDSDPDGDTISLLDVSQPTSGAAEIQNGEVSYTPAADFIGTDSFTYTISDGNGETATATVVVTVDGARFYQAGNNLVFEATSGDDRIRVFSLQDRTQIVVDTDGLRYGPLALPQNGIVQIYAEEGNDLVWIAEYLRIPTQIFGGPGEDRLFGGRGVDTIIGGTGNDQIVGSDGHNWLVGGVGDDSLIGRESDDVLDGGGGNDVLIGSRGNDALYGGPGNDLLFADHGNDLLEGGEGDDELNGGHGNDLAQGDSGADLLRGDYGNDILLGGLGQDDVAGGRGDDAVSGGSLPSTLSTSLVALLNAWANGSDLGNRIDAANLFADDDGEEDQLAGGDRSADYFFSAFNDVLVDFDAESDRT